MTELLDLHPNYRFMLPAIQAAKQNHETFGEHPIGATLVRGTEIVAVSGNRCHQTGVAHNHAELAVIEEACKKLGTRYLTDCFLYTTHDPCPTCAWAIVTARLAGVVSGTTGEDVKYLLVTPRDFRLQEVDPGDIFRTADHRPEFFQARYRFDCRHLLLICQLQRQLPFEGVEDNLFRAGDWLLTPNEFETAMFGEADLGISITQLAKMQKDAGTY